MNHNCIENMTLNGASGLSQVKTVSRASTHTYSMTRVNDGQWIDSFFYFAMFLNLSCRLLADGRPNLAPIVANIPASGLCRRCRYFDTMNSGWTETWAHWSRGLIASHQSNVRGDCKALKAITHYAIWLYLVRVCWKDPATIDYWWFHSVIWLAERTNAAHRNVQHSPLKSKSRGTSSAVKTLTCGLWEELGCISSISSFATLSCCKQH